MNTLQVTINIDRENDYLIDNFINAYYFYLKEDKLITNETLFYQKYKVIFDELLVNQLNPNYNKIYDDFYRLEYKDINYNRIINLFIIIFKIFNGKKLVNNDKINTTLEINNFTNTDIKKKLIIRTGVVELNVMNYMLYGDINMIKECINNIKLNFDNDNQDYFYKNSPKSCWIAKHFTLKDIETCIKILMTNAGFYFNKSMSVDEIYNDLLKFSLLYKECIINSDYIFYWSFLNCFMLDVLNEKKNIKPINNIGIPNRLEIIKIFDNKKILFLTPFKEKIDKIYQSGKIYNLRKEAWFNFKKIDLHTIETFLTTYPNTKHNNFFETLEYYKQKIDEIMEEHTFNIFISTVGCYGLLLSDYVYNKYRITSYYYGHSLNEEFGIISNRSSIDKSKNIENYEYSDLNERYLNIDKIENNCYGKKEE